MSEHFEPAVTPFIVFSDSTIQELGSGKLSLIGTFDALFAQKFPFQSPPFICTTRITNINPAAGQKLAITIRIEEPGSGHVLGNVSLEIAFPHPIQRESIIQLPLPIGSIMFQKPGKYDVVVLINNEAVGKRPLNVNPLPATPPQTQP